MRLNLPAFAACTAKIMARAGVDQQTAEAILQDIADHAEKLRNQGEADPFGTAARQRAESELNNARQARLDAVRNATIRANMMADIERQGGLKNAARVLRDLLHGTNVGGRDSIQSQWRGLASGWQAVLSNRLHQAGLEKAAITGELDREIAQELWDMRKVGPSKPGAVTGNNAARQIAETVLPLVNMTRDRLNAAGARIAEATDYVAHTEHDPRKMRAAAGPGRSPDEAFGAWWQAEQPRWSEQAFEDVTPREGESTQQARTRFARSVFDALVSGIHMTAVGQTGIKFEGPGNLSKRVSQPRLIRYKDAQSWIEHQQQFGSSPTLMASIMATLDKSARQVALMEKLGTNPGGNFNTLIGKIEETYRSDLDGLEKFRGKVAGLKNVMGRLDGSLNIPENQMWANIAASTRTIESMSSLGGVGVTHFASIWPTVTSEMVHHGISRLETLGNMVPALTRGKGSAERQAILADLGAYASGLSRDMFSRWQPDDPIPGRISSLANVFMKYTGIHYVFDNTQAAVREMLAQQLGRSVDKSFAQLDPHLSQMLGKYGLGEEEWNLLRAVKDMPVSEGRRYMTPNMAREIDPEAAQAYATARGLADTEAVSRSLSDKLLSYYSDAAAHAVVTPGVRERAILLGSTRPGSLGGELLRFTTQFKMWPVAAMSQVIGREIFMSLSAKEAAWNLGTLTALSAAFGYLRMTINDVATGRPVRNPMDPKTMLAGMAQGGGVGILGDFLFGETNRMGGGLVSTLMGPIASDADTLVQLFNKFRADATDPAHNKHKNGQFADLWPDLAHFAWRHVPFANLVYLKGALDYMIAYHLFEAASPGWWERTNRRLQKEQGRTMTGYSPGGGVPYGAPGLYLRNQAGQSFGLLGQH